MMDVPSIQVAEPRIPPYVVCPYCNEKYPFAKQKEHWRTVRNQEEFREQY